jgi:DNA invertase Pin-like site-specific DNA recombinase
MGERAARWFRVSSDGQAEGNQVREVDGHIAGHGYEVARTFQLHDVSASKGEQEAALAEALGDIQAGLYSVIVIAHSSRIDRRDVDIQQLYAIKVRMAGGRIESAREPQFGQTDIGGRLLTLIAQDANHQYVKTLTEHVRAAFEVIDANGAWRNKPPWGFATTGSKHSKRLVPTAQGREYIPQVYGRVIAGQSLAQVCRWLEAEGVSPVGVAKAEDSDGNPVTRGKSGQWWPRSLGQLIRNPAYMGRAVVNAATGQEHVWTTEDEPALVDAHTWKRAGEALDSRPHRGPVLKENRCALSGAARCAACGGPLYKIKAGNGNKHLYLRCAGTGAARKSCGAGMIQLETAEALADEVLGSLLHPVFEYSEIPGNEAELDARLAALDYERRQVALRGLSWADEDAERARIRAEYEIVLATPRIPSRRMMRDTGVTYGQRWAKLDAHGRADWLRSEEFEVSFIKGEADRADATRDGVSLVLTWLE